MRKKTTKIIDNNQPTNVFGVDSSTLSMNLEDYIVVTENVLSKQLCQKILKEYSKTNEWQKTTVGTGVVAENIRSAESINISNSNTLAVNYATRKEIDDLVFEGAGKAISSYINVYPLARIETDSGYDLLRYQKGQHYVEHVDSYVTHPRAISCSFALNENFEGGEFAFFNRKIIKKIPAGSAIMFPSSFQYPHEILPVTKGIRYSIITWFI